jgi:predicted helicase
MPRIDPELQRLQEIKTLPSLIKYLKDDLNWPIGSDDVESVVFDYDPAELGFDSASTAKIEEVCQLRPLTPGQKWGVFWVKFGKKQLPVQMLRRALGNLVVKKRTSTKKADKAAWHMHDLLFISAYGDDSNRHITFAHFSESEDSEKSLPVLKVLSWDEDDTLLHLKDTYKSLVTCLNWENTPTDDPEAWREHWSKAFKLTHKEVINTTKELVVELAHLATIIKKSVLTSINAETEKGHWKKLMLAFQKTLIKDLNEEQFADVIAQTVSYGLLTARLSSDGQISLKNLVDMVPSTNPFLKELLQHFLNSAGMKGLFDVDEAGINDVVELLNRANAQAIRNDFGKKTDGEDPVIHFYEHFLGAYNKQLKVERGVFYTPQAVVTHIVRSVHQLLQVEFGLEDGLADTSTWTDLKKKNKALKVPVGINPDIEPFVQILDPATGTATFLIEVIDVIHNTMVARWEKERISKPEQIKRWNAYVPTHLLPRLYAYELMMAPYAIAHMKVGLKLTETGFTEWDKLGAENRANIFLTNALEPPTQQLDLPGFVALAHEAAAVNVTKRNKRFTVIIGNPPYSVHSSNDIPSMKKLMDDYKQIDGVAIDEARIAPLMDDYCKFLRLSDYLIDYSGIGIIGMITNHSFLTGPVFRGMRHSLKSRYSADILDLHGNYFRGDPARGDTNIFAIRPGVCITILFRSHTRLDTRLTYSELRGPFENKLKQLVQNGRAPCESVKPLPPLLVWTPALSGNDEYASYVSITDMFSVGTLGMMTGKDHFMIAWSKSDMRGRVADLFDRNQPDQVLRVKYDLADSRDWVLKNARAPGLDAKLLVPVNYRPFDVRWTYYHRDCHASPQRRVNDPMLISNNLALCVPRQLASLPFAHCFVTSNVTEMSLISNKTKEANRVFPLYLLSSNDSLFRGENTSNLRMEFLVRLRSACGNGAQYSPSPEEAFQYVYAILYSPNYRSLYADFLKVDFPRLPLPGNSNLFRCLAKLGADLISLHTLKCVKAENNITQMTGNMNNAVEKVSWADDTVWVDKEQTFGFVGVKLNVWNFQIGAYRVCEKWLKDRKDRKLSKDDIEHYQKIVVAISETIRLMSEIDKVIDEHGGWPGAFQAAK